MNETNKLFKNKSHEKSFWKNYQRRMSFARDNGCNTMVITSTGEATQNPEFVKNVLKINSKLDKPFRWIELQTSGIGLEKMFEKYPEIAAEISTVSLSIVDFNTLSNTEIMRMPEYLDTISLIAYLKENNFNVRISLNMTKVMEGHSPRNIFNKLRGMDVDQITFRILYKTSYKSEQNDWIDVNKVSDNFVKELSDFIKLNGRKLERLPFGAVKYSLMGISTVLDDDCMATEDKEAIRYLILRSNGKLYSKWDDKGSLIF